MKNYSYVTLLTDDSYIYGIILLLESLKKVKSKYPLYVLVTNNVSTAGKEILNQLDLSYDIIEVIQTPEDIYQHNCKIDTRLATTWKYCWTKFKIFNLTQFDKIVYLDADLLVFKNLDDLFEWPHMTAALDGEYFNLWPNWDHFNSGCLVIEPSNQVFNDIINFANSLTVEQLKDTLAADQEVLNLYYSDWKDKPKLHLNKYYNIFAPYIQEEQIQDVEQNSFFIHFVGRKPWNFWIKNPAETYTEYFYVQAKNIITNFLPTLDWNKIHSKLILTVYAICKNEKNNIKKWLNSFGEADYICILDTGSTDGTWELLQSMKKKYKNLIIDQKTISPWRFDTARNLNLAMIPSNTDIFFMADLDEVIKEKGWSQVVKNAWTPTFHRGEFTYNRIVDKNDKVERAMFEYRIHSKKWCKYKNIVHEALINEQGEKNFYQDDATKIDITVWHYPDSTKDKNYIALCEESLTENPDDYVMRLQLAIEYEIGNKTEEALYHFSYLINNQNTLQSFELARCYAGAGVILINRNENTKAFALFREGRLLCPFFFDNYIIPAIIYTNNDKNNQSIELIKTGLMNCTEAFWCSIYDPYTSFPYYVLATNHANKGEQIIALGYVKLAETINNMDENIKELTKKIIQDPIDLI